MKEMVTQGIAQFLLHANVEEESLKQRTRKCVGGSITDDWSLGAQASTWWW